MEFIEFNKAYVERLRDGDPATEEHFFVYFGKFLRIKLRARRLPPDRIDDLVQETFKRVLEAVRRPGGVREPDRFGAYVAGTNRNILLEYYNSSAKNQATDIDNGHTEIPDKVIDLDGMMIRKETVAHVRRILRGLPDRDQQILRALFLEEKEKDTVCQEFAVKRDYLRVLVHRAKDKFRSLYEKQ
jgi:RNA polymerase sigma-70 factor, ECF subfamily